MRVVLGAASNTIYWIALCCGSVCVMAPNADRCLCRLLVEVIESFEVALNVICPTPSCFVCSLLSYLQASA